MWNLIMQNNFALHLRKYIKVINGKAKKYTVFLYNTVPYDVPCRKAIVQNCAMILDKFLTNKIDLIYFLCFPILKNVR